MSSALALLVALSIHGAPRDLAAIVADAEVARRAGNWSRTLELLEEAYASHPQPELLNNIGRALEALGRYREAVERYQRVVDDAAANPALRALDVARVAALRPQLEITELQVAVREPSKLWIDGQAVAEGMINLQGGPHVFELYDGGTRRSYLRTQQLPTGERRRLEHVDLTNQADDAQLVVGGLAQEGLTVISIDAYRLRADVTRIDRVTVAQGRHTIAVVQHGKARSAQLSAGADEVLAIEELLAAAAPSPAAELTIPAPPASEEPPSDSSLAPVLLGAAGVIAGGAGFGLWMSARADRRAVDEAALDPQGRIVGLTYRQADDLERSANHKASAAGAISIAAAGALTVAVIWLLSE